jgi:hypothetical protein
MKPLTTGLACLSLTLPTAAQWDHQYNCGEGHLIRPGDVAVFEVCGAPQYVFVTDTWLQALVRFTGDGSGASAPATFAFGDDPRGIAVNDIPGHVNNGQLYVAGTNTVEVLTLGGAPLTSMFMSAASGLQDPQGIALDQDGDLYVADEAAGWVLKFDSSQFEWPHQPTVDGAPIAVYTSYVGAANGPMDVSVDSGGRVHVAYRSGHVLLFDASGYSFAYSALNVANIGGLDAKGAAPGSWTSNGIAAERADWDLSTGLPLPAVESTPGVLVQGAGLESARFTYQNTPCKPYTGEERLFVADPGAAVPHVAVFGSSRTSIAVPIGWTAWWRFDEETGPTAADVFKLNDGTWSSGPAPQAESGKVACALDFGFAGAGVTVPDDPKLDFGTGDFTIEMWLRVDPNTSSVHTLLDKRGSNAGYAVALTDGYFGINLDDDVSTYANFYPHVPENFVGDGAWHHVAAVVDRTGIPSTQLYVDGVAVSVIDPSPRMGDLSSEVELLFGQNRSNPSYVLRGALDEVTIYKRALSAWEVGRIHGAGGAGKHVRCRFRKPSVTPTSTPPRGSTAGQL